MSEELTLYKEEENKRKGIFISIAMHMLLLLLCIYPLMSHLDPPPEQRGILVHFSEFDEGGDDSNPAQQPVIDEAPKPIIEQAQSTSVPTPTSVKSIETETIVQDAEVIATTDQSNTDEEKEDRAKEEERLSQAEAQRIEEERRREQEAYEEQKKKFGDIFSSGLGGGSDQQDAGDEDGDPNADILTGMSTGKGDLGDGLDDRGLVFVPQIEDDSQKTGKVVIKVCVDKSGRVVEQHYTQRGSTTTDEYLINVALSAAARYRFTTSDQEKQCGTITIEFKLK